MMNLDFLKSALTTQGDFLSNEGFFEWLNERKRKVSVNVTKIPFADMDHWGFDAVTHNLQHSSGRFFKIEGINVETNWGTKSHWTQPIINQNEIGFLGIIAQKRNGILHFLMQCKIEPGNINFVQLSPTLQATKSNYSRVHKGNAPLYLEYFVKENRHKHTVLLDQLQSEQGARFLRKRNRNIIIQVEEEIAVHEDFCWLTLGQIHQILIHDNVINMDTRTVISGIPYGDYGQDTISLYETLRSAFNPDLEFESGMMYSAIERENHLHTSDEIISWFTELKTQYELEVRQIPLNTLDEWEITDREVRHKDSKYFKVIAVKAEIENREVMSWTQPLVESVQEGIIAFIIKKINGVHHFMVQAKLEAGNLDILEMAPSVQCLTGNYRKEHAEYEPHFLHYVLNRLNDPKRVHYSALQSEEGGRFFKEQNRNIIIEAEDDFDETLPEGYIWMTLNQLKMFIRFNNYLNIQARGLLSAIRFNRYE